jgi:hypothetical protein
MVVRCRRCVRTGRTQKSAAANEKENKQRSRHHGSLLSAVTCATLNLRTFARCDAHGEDRGRSGSRFDRAYYLEAAQMLRCYRSYKAIS